MPRGGKRQGTPGKGYSNRTDLALDPNMAVNTAATGGMTAPPAPQQPPAVLPGALVGTDEIPNLSAPTARPGEHVMTGVNYGPGAGSEALGPLPPAPTDPVRQILQALDLNYPNPDIARALAQMEYEGR